MHRPERDGPRLHGIHIYPFKSACGISVPEVEVDEVGLRHDRRWMLIDADGAFLSRRTHPRMALIRTELTDGALGVSADGFGRLSLPLAADGRGPTRRVQVWREGREALDCGDEAAEWASALLGVGCRVVRAPDRADGLRVTEDGWVLAGFADAQPALVVSTASLDDLNARLDAPLPMNRFRPNLVVSGVGAHDEDSWTQVRVGGVRVLGLRPCPRCVATTVEEETGHTGKEPLRTLATYRRGPDGQVYFGLNARFLSEGVLRVGDRISLPG